MIPPRLLKCVLLSLLLLSVACSGEDEPPTPRPSPQIATRPPTTVEPIAAPVTPTTPPTPEPTPTVPPPSEVGALGLVQSFVESPYRVIAIARNPHTPNSLVVANRRARTTCGTAERPRRCTDDDSCGSLTTAPTCFFFVEPHFDAPDPLPRFVARWPEEPALAALVPDSIRFINARTVEFRAEGSDDDLTVAEVWWLDLVTGAVALQGQIENPVGGP